MVRSEVRTTTIVEPISAASRKRSLIKTVSWRIVASTTTFLIAWMVTGNLTAGAAIGGAEAVTKMFLYYGHERAWERFGT
jgi:uncharacterized membrane protein